MQSSSSALKYLLLFIITIATIGVLVLGYQQYKNRSLVIEGEAQAQIPPLLTDCKFFYQICPTSMDGKSTKNSVQTLLNTVSSPLLSIYEVPYFLPNGTETDPVPPTFVITYLSTENNINAFLLMTLSELATKSITQNPALEKPILRSSEITGFYQQYRTVALELSNQAIENELTPNNLDVPITTDSVEYFGKTYALAPNTPAATLIVAQYLASMATDQAEFERWLEEFPVVYQQIAGIDPTSDEFEYDDRLSR